MLKYLMETFDIGKREIMKGGAYHNFMDFFQFPNPKAPQLERPSISPLPDKEIDAFPTIVAAMKERNRILHFPYQTYDYVIRFLNQAAIDPSVKHIYATQYRVASNSAIVNALIRAAQQGRKVTVFVEITARFDEALNLHMAQEMEKAGIKIIYTVPKLKVHAKVALVIREEDSQEKGYAFLSTGNFNEKTARIYSDFGYFTTDEDLIAELREVFAFLVDPKYRPKPFEKLLVAPFNIRQQFTALIDREIAHARAGRQAEILMKLNNIDDTQMIDKLYEASQAGVRIRMIVRGMCSILPEVPGLSDHITIIRIVDQFLEHARAWWFRNDGQDELYLGSSDWMQRNLSRRVEVVFPLRNPALKAEVMQILHIQLADNVKAVRLNAKMENRRIEPGSGPAIRSQIEIYERIRDGRLMDEV
jgi:polyphosphate kinase